MLDEPPQKNQTDSDPRIFGALIKLNVISLSAETLGIG